MRIIGQIQHTVYPGTVPDGLQLYRLAMRKGCLGIVDQDVRPILFIQGFSVYQSLQSFQRSSRISSSSATVLDGRRPCSFPFDRMKEKEYVCVRRCKR